MQLRMKEQSTNAASPESSAAIQMILELAAPQRNYKLIRIQMLIRPQTLMHIVKAPTIRSDVSSFLIQASLLWAPCQHFRHSKQYMHISMADSSGNNHQTSKTKTATFAHVMTSNWCLHPAHTIAYLWNKVAWKKWNKRSTSVAQPCEVFPSASPAPSNSCKRWPRCPACRQTPGMFAE